jgi:hypothetical protein
VARFDSDKKSRTFAVKVLSARDALSKQLLQDILDPDSLRPDRKRVGRDTDNGVLAETARAVVAQFADGAVPEPDLLSLVVRLIADPATFVSVVASTLNILHNLEPDDALRAIAAIRAGAVPFTTTHPALPKGLEFAEAHAVRMKMAHEEFLAVFAAPEEHLKTLYRDAPIALERVTPPEQKPRYLFRVETHAVHIVFADEEVTDAPTREGFKYMQVLLGRREMPPLDGAKLESEPVQGHFGGDEHADPETRSSVKSEIKRIKKELEDAMEIYTANPSATGELEKVQALNEQLEQNKKYLNNAQGLFERSRRTSGSDDKAKGRVRTAIFNVKKWLRDNYDDKAPNLVHHLTTYIRTDGGFYYDPGPHVVEWEF